MAATARTDARRPDHDDPARHAPTPSTSPASRPPRSPPNVRGDGVCRAPTSRRRRPRTVPQTVAAWAGHYTVMLNNSGRRASPTCSRSRPATAPTRSRSRAWPATRRIEGGDGDDRIAVGSNATATTNTGGTLEGIDAALTVVGGAPTASDVLLIDDSGDPDGETGQVTSTADHRLGPRLRRASPTPRSRPSRSPSAAARDTANVRSTARGRDDDDQRRRRRRHVPAFERRTDEPRQPQPDLRRAHDRRRRRRRHRVPQRPRRRRLSDTGTLAFATLTGYSPAVITYLQHRDARPRPRRRRQQPDDRQPRRRDA